MTSTPHAHASAARPSHFPGPKGTILRRVAAAGSWLIAIFVFVIFRSLGDESMYNVSLNAAALIASFGFFASTIQDRIPFLLSYVGLVIPLAVTAVVVFVYHGADQEWLTLLLAALTVATAGLAALLPQQPNIWRKIDHSITG